MKNPACTPSEYACTEQAWNCILKPSAHHADSSEDKSAETDDGARVYCKSFECTHDLYDVVGDRLRSVTYCGVESRKAASGRRCTRVPQSRRSWRGQERPKRRQAQPGERAAGKQELRPDANDHAYSWSMSALCLPERDSFGTVIKSPMHSSITRLLPICRHLDFRSRTVPARIGRHIAHATAPSMALTSQSQIPVSVGYLSRVRQQVSEIGADSRSTRVTPRRI